MYRFSVVICTYNGERYIREQIESILNQERKVDEIVVCDDGSTDRTVDIVKRLFTEFGFEHYRIMGPQATKGVAANFLRGLKASTGDYAFTCDQDDVWLPDKVAIFADAIEASNKQLYFSDGFVVDSDLSKRGYSLWDTLGFSARLLDNGTMLDVLLSRCVVTGAAMVVSRELIDQVEEIPSCWLHDGWLAAVAACNDSIQPIDRKTFLYRQHGGNVVGAHSDSLLGRTENWMRNISEQKKVRKQRYERYACIQQRRGSGNQDLARCLRFWGELCALSEKGLAASLGTIARLFADGSYGRYYTGARGAVRDVLSLLLPEESERT